MTPRSRALLAASAWVAVLATLPTGAHGATSTLLECLEGADFIANAAASRDNGLERGVFLDRLEGDFVAIRAFPVALRWFVKDADDEAFLRACPLGGRRAQRAAGGSHYAVARVTQAAKNAP